MLFRSERFKKLQEIANEPDGLNKLEKLFGGGSAVVAATILNDPKYLEASRQNVKGALNFGAGSIAQPGDVQIRAGGNYFYNFTGKIGTLDSQQSVPVAAVPDKGQPSVAPAPTQQMVQQQVAQQVAQPPASQRAPQVNVVPMNAGGGQQPTEKPILPPSVSGYNQRQVSFFPSTNPDNFLTLYSKMVYNIVDG